MANVFGILTAIVLALSAFIAFKNKAAYEAKITETSEEKSKLVKTKARLDAAAEVVAVRPAEITTMDGEVATLTAEESAQTKKNEDLKAKADDTTTKIAANKQKLDEIREKTAATGDLQELASKMRATNSELEELSQSITESNAKLANVTAQNSASDAQVASAKSKFDNYSSGQSLPALNTRIRSIYPNWGFVTLAAGNSSGVVSNSTLNVVRGGETVAQLLVTAVETNSASASIVPDSLGADVTLMVGDTVVPGLKAASKSASAPAKSN